MTVTEQSVVWLERLANRGRNPVRQSTINTYAYILNKWIVPRMGTMPLGDVTNASLKEMILVMSRHGKAPGTIQMAVHIIREVLRSDRDPVTGARLHNLDFDPDFCDLPVVDPRLQKTPIVAPETVLEAISGAPEARRQYRALYALLAGSGLRISEAVAIRVGQMATVTYWDPDAALIHVQTQVYNGVEGPPKTDAGLRDVDLCASLNQFLIREALALNRKHKQLLFQISEGRPLRSDYARQNITSSVIKGFHSFRRFRATHLRAQQTPEDLIRYWLGHSSSNITDRYSKLSQRLDVRREWAEKVGVGFTLPEGQ